MIVRHIPMKSIQKSSFSGLIEYLTSAHGKHERVGEISITHCQSNDLEWTVHEIEATQHQNQRAQGDRTYHLLISFPAGEAPSPDVLKDIEENVCASIGFDGYQRVSVVHHDTDNFHLHVGINKVHPISHTLHEPYLAYKKLANIATQLELKHNLQITNHIPRKTGSENRADDMEHHAGIESLLNWIKQTCSYRIKKAESWAELHDVLQENGLEIRERGNGLIITDGSGICVKASSVSRDFSKNKLEVKLGLFQQKRQSDFVLKDKNYIRKNLSKVGHNPPPHSQNRLYNLNQIESMGMDNGNQYSGLPIHPNFNTDRLYSQYQVEQHGISINRSKDISRVRGNKDRSIESLKRTARLKRAAIKLLKGSDVNKKALYSAVSNTLRKNIEKEKLQYLKERSAIYEKYQRRTWADWLKFKSLLGDSDALKALRARDGRKKLSGNVISGEAKKIDYSVKRVVTDNITKKGTIIYRVGTCAIRDDGDVFKVSRGSTPDGLETLLRLAIDRYGNNIKVFGSETFKNQIVKTAVNLKLDITFDDATLQKLKQALTSENKNGQRNRKQYERGASSRHGTQFTQSRTLASAQRQPRDGKFNDGRYNKPNIGRIGHLPPPESKNRLRNLSELGVVQLSSRSEMLLSSHVLSHLEHQGAESNDRLRRDISGERSIIHVSAAADKYISERELKRKTMKDVLHHRRYQSVDEGVLKFAGLRQVDGEMLALLKQDQQIIVYPVDERTANRMKRLVIGEQVKLTPAGLVFSRRIKR